MDGGGIKRYKVGIKRVDITPYGKSVYMGGFDFNRKSTGVLHPIFARALYMSDGKTDLVIVACDVIGLFNEFVIKIREEMQREFSEPLHIIVCSTHNHEGPDTMGYWGRAVMNVPIISGTDMEYMHNLKENIKRAIRYAKEDMEEVDIYAGYSYAPSYLTENVRKNGYKDDRISFLKFNRPDGSIKGFFVNFGCHPEGLWASNTLISADYPGILMKYMEERTGGCGVFVSGALGGMVTPNIEEDAVFADRLRYTTMLGESLGRIILEEKDTLRKLDFAPLVHINQKIRINLNNPKFLLLKKLGIFKREIVENQITSEVNLIRIGDAIIFGVPGEILPSMGLKIRARLNDFRDVFIIALCCDELGYILAPDEFNEKELYKYEISMSAGKELSLEILKSVYYCLSLIQ